MEDQSLLRTMPYSKVVIDTFIYSWHYLFLVCYNNIQIQPYLCLDYTKVFFLNSRLYVLRYCKSGCSEVACSFQREAQSWLQKRVNLLQELSWIFSHDATDGEMPFFLIGK